MRQHRIVIELDPSGSIQQGLQDRLSFCSVAATGVARYCHFAILLRGEDDTLLGGLFGELWANWLHVKTLWIDEMERGKGYGRQPMEYAERFCNRARL
jgi:GNAT superfamily N-acetyltransferase